MANAKLWPKIPESHFEVVGVDFHLRTSFPLMRKGPAGHGYSS